VHLLVDSTGLKLCGAGEWLIAKHSSRRRRAWKTLHLATDADTGHIAASVLTDKDTDDGSQVSPLLEQVDGSVASFTGMAPMTGTTYIPRSWRAIPVLLSSSRHARARSRVRLPRSCRRSGTRIYDVSPSVAGWAGHRPAFGEIMLRPSDGPVVSSAR
jgi:Transposase DDE domain